MPISAEIPPSTAPALIAARDPLAEARQRLIVALDVPSAQAASDLVDRLEGACGVVRSRGLELFVAAEARGLLEPLIARGHSVFLDLKFHDIPNTVAGAVSLRSKPRRADDDRPRSRWPRHARCCTHRSPLRSLKPARTSRRDHAHQHGRRPGFRCRPRPLARRACRIPRCRMGLSAGIRGFVCSPQEVARLRAIAGPSGILVIPGIRPAGSETGDQKRIATPADALRQGASYLVVGRPITQAPNPAEAAQGVLEEMARALPA